MTDTPTPQKPEGIGADLFMHETTGVTRTLGRKAKVEVVFEGDTAMTDGSTITMPSLPKNATLNDAQSRALRGYADHEAAHLRHTETDFWKRKFPGKEVPVNLQELTNAVEDIRIEGITIREYPGTQKNLAATTRLVAKHNARKLDAMSAAERTKVLADPKASLTLAIAMEGRRRQETATDTCEVMLKQIDPKVRAYAEKALDWLAGARYGKAGTEDSAAIAQAVLNAVLNDIPPEKMQPPKAIDGTGGGGADDEYDPSGDDKEVELGEGGHGGKGASGYVMDSEAAFLARAAKQRSGVFDTDNKTVASSVTKEVTSALGKGAFRVLSTRYDRWHTRHDKQNKFTRKFRSSPAKGWYLGQKAGVKRFDDAVASTKSTIGVMRRKLERMVMAKQRRDWDTNKEFGSLDPKRLASVATGSTTVFRKRSDRIELDTSVCVLIDLSGSMSGSKARVAQQISIALAQCMESIGLDYSVYGFNNCDAPAFETEAEANEHYRLRAERNPGWGRLTPQDMYVFKEFDEKLRDARSAMGQIEEMVGGDNHDGEAIGMAWDRLRARRSKRKVLLVLSDGSPACACSVSVNGMPGVYWRTHDAIRTVMREGGECFGIGIMDASVKEFYPEYVVTKSLEEFANRSMDMMARILLQSNRISLAKAA